MNSIIPFLPLMILGVDGYLGSSSGSMILFQRDLNLHRGDGTATSITRTIRHTSSNKLNYKDDKSPFDTTPSSSYKQINTHQQKKKQKEQQQEIVDEYLEYLDRRYHRYYDNHEDKDDTIQVQFPLLNWLLSSSNNTENRKNDKARRREHNNENALYVFGVANLASKKLLLKYHRQSIDNEGDSISSSPPRHQNDDNGSIISLTSFIRKPLAIIKNRVRRKNKVMKKRSALYPGLCALVILRFLL